MKLSPVGKTFSISVSIVALGVLGSGSAGAAPGAPLTLSVNCSAGDTIGDALRTASGTFAPVTITVSGVCNERVVISRDDVTIEGAGDGAVLDGSTLTGLDAVLTVATAQRVLLRSLTLTPAGLPGVLLEPGSVVRAVGLDIEGASFGLILRDNSYLAVSSSTVMESKQTGIENEGGALDVDGTTVAKGHGSGVGVTGGALKMRDCKVYDNDGWGVSIGAGSANIYRSLIEENLVGLFARQATAGVGDGTVLDGNREGMRAWDGSTVLLGDVSVSGNSGTGITLLGASVLVPGRAVIKANGEDGIAALDTSLVRSTYGVSPDISHNAGWGVRCEGAPGDARLGSPGFLPSAVHSNAAGQISCPGYFRP